MAWRVISHTTVYREEGWYAQVPNVVRTPGGDLLVLFHRSPDMHMGYGHHSHPLFDVRACRSSDEGENWSEAELAVTDPLGGILDFGTHALSDGSIFLHASTVELVPKERTDTNDYWISQGGKPFWVRSRDDGRTWSNVKRFPPIPDAIWGAPAEHSGVCRSGLLTLPSGRLLLPSKATDDPQCKKPFFGMIRYSDDLGETWHYGGRIAEDTTHHFSEPYIHRTPNGKIIVLFRCHPPEGERRLVIVTSDDDGNTWSPWRMTNIRGFPAHILALVDGRMFVSVGTRRTGQNGCICRICDPEGADLETVPDIPIRSDSLVTWRSSTDSSFEASDCGYPWAVELSDGRVLVVYYYVYGDGTRGIEGSILEEG